MRTLRCLPLILAALSIKASARPIEVGSAIFRGSAQLPEVVFTGENPHSIIANACLDIEWPVTRNETGTVTCETPPNEMSALVDQLRQSRATLRAAVSFTIVKNGSQWRVQGRSFGERQNVFGQTTATAGGVPNELVQEFLIMTGGQPVSAGSLFGRDLGLRGVVTQADRGSDYWLVTKVRAGSVAEQMGIQVNDRIIKIGGRSVDSTLPATNIAWQFANMRSKSMGEIVLDRQGTQMAVTIPFSGP